MKEEIPLDMQSRKVYDRETVLKTAIFLKGVGTYCVVCGNHMFKRQKNQETCSQKCRAKKHYIKKGRRVFGEGLHVYLSLKKIEGKKPYRIMRVYLNRGVTEEIKLTPEHKELWALSEKISNFRKHVTNSLHRTRRFCIIDLCLHLRLIFDNWVHLK